MTGFRSNLLVCLCKENRVCRSSPCSGVKRKGRFLSSLSTPLRALIYFQSNCEIFDFSLNHSIRIQMKFKVSNQKKCWDLAWLLTNCVKLRSKHSIALKALPHFPCNRRWSHKTAVHFLFHSEIVPTMPLTGIRPVITIQVAYIPYLRMCVYVTLKRVCVCVCVRMCICYLFVVHGSF